jgi:hypothetical protein
MSNRAIVRPTEKTVTTNVRLPEHVWRLLRGLAERRATEEGGRPSASAIISGLIVRASMGAATEKRPRRRAA